MARDFFPRREVDIVTWSQLFRSRISANWLLYGLSEEQSDHYALTQQAFADLFAAANASSTRTPSLIVAKDAARIALEAETRMLARIIRSHPGVTVPMRCELGLSLRNTGGGGSRIRPPAAAPMVHVEWMPNGSLKLRLTDAESQRQRKPRGVCGATILAFTGDQPSASPGDWALLGRTSRCEFVLSFGSRPPGTKVWLAAFWSNGREERGPASLPIMVRVPFAGIAAYAPLPVETQPLKLAA